MRARFDNSYTRLPARLYVRQTPTPVRAPELFAWNAGLADRLGIAGDPDAAILAGNRLPEGAEPIAQAYAGHQFGGWVPQLGDGRAVLLGEVIAPDGARFDLALKGAGQTPFSRRGDGRAALGPVLREYIVSEAMAALGVPTTRALAATLTGEVVWRDTAQPGAVLARVAASHIRIGTFQYLAARQDAEGLAALTDHVIARHHPAAEGALGLLDSVIAAQAALVAQWMALGFIHGVMNTDNMTVSGETIDYGPCAFVDGFHPETVFSSIDQYGRYAWINQPAIAHWNLAQLASCLVPLIGPDDTAIPAATAALSRFPDLYRAAWLARFGAKLGLAAPTPEDAPLIEDLLRFMAEPRADFTRVFAGLATGRAAAEFADPTAFADWERRWSARLSRETGAEARMRAANPVLIPRNHRVAQAIAAAEQGDAAPFHRLVAALSRPFNADAETEDLAQAPAPAEAVTQTFCGT